MSSAHPKLTIAIPTRERAQYLKHSLQTCLLDSSPLIEVLVLDNASNDNTEEIARAIKDERIRYLKSPVRLSMRDNFERGLNEARGEIIGFIGDDDGLLPSTVSRVLDHFSQPDVDALTSSRAHYFWPDLLASRRNMALLPRGKGLEFLESRQSLRKVLSDGNYYNTPCLYHGFAKMDIVRRIIDRQGRFFLSSQVDMYSSIALSMEGIRFIHSRSPLVINGGSNRSNGASHFGGGTSQEKSLWKAEDDMGLLPGFDNYCSIESLIIESAIRHIHPNSSVFLDDIFDTSDLKRSIDKEIETRLAKGQAIDEVDKLRQAIHAKLGSNIIHTPNFNKKPARAIKLMKSFIKNRPIDMTSFGVSNVAEASIVLDNIIRQDEAGIFFKPLDQIIAALKFSKFS